MTTALPPDDLKYIGDSLSDVVAQLKDTRVFITGGTGFFGKWLLGTIIFLNEKEKTNCSAVVLSRNPEKFQNNYPQFNHPSISWVRGDVKDFPFPEGNFDFCIHAANETENLDKTDELEIINAAQVGTLRVLEFVRKKKVSSTLYISSGAIYGKQPPELRYVSEDFAGAPDLSQLKSCYGEGKRLAEFLCTYYGKKYNLSIKIARCFAFVGAYLPLDSHFACGNFILNSIKGEPIVIKGDGTTVRSYMYAADLVVCLFRTLFYGESLSPYNIGSVDEISIKQLAEKVASCFTPSPEIIIMQKRNEKVLPERYVPNNSKAMERLGIEKYIEVDEAIKRTVNFYKNEGKLLY